MTLEEIKGRLKTLHVKCDHNILQPSEIEPLVKRAAAHFGLAENLVSVTNTRLSLLSWEFAFIYNGETRVSYDRCLQNNMPLCWVETCTLDLIGAVLSQENPSIAKEIKKLFHK